MQSKAPGAETDVAVEYRRNLSEDACETVLLCPVHFNYCNWFGCQIAPTKKSWKIIGNTTKVRKCECKIIIGPKYPGHHLCKFWQARPVDMTVDLKYSMYAGIL